MSHEEFEGTKREINSRKSKKERQYQKIKDKKTNNDLENQ